MIVSCVMVTRDREKKYCVCIYKAVINVQLVLLYVGTPKVRVLVRGATRARQGASSETSVECGVGVDRDAGARGRTETRRGADFEWRSSQR